jgi:hypothetical protein
VVITEERFWALLLESNPFPEAVSSDEDAIDVTAHLTALKERSSRMSQIDSEAAQRQQIHKGREGRPGPEMKWLAAALAVVVAGLAVFLIARTQDDAPTADNPLGIATAFLDAQNQHDGATMSSLTAVNATLAGLLVEDPADFELLAQFERGVGWQVVVDRCTDFDPVPDGSVRVFCMFEVESNWNRALGHGPIPNNSIRFVINHGKIQDLSHELGSEIVDVQRPFQTWLSQAHPEDAIRMFRQEDLQNPAFPAARPLLTHETVSLFAQYTDEYLAAEEGNN